MLTEKKLVRERPPASQIPEAMAQSDITKTEERAQGFRRRRAEAVIQSQRQVAMVATVARMSWLPGRSGMGSRSSMRPARLEIEASQRNAKIATRRRVARRRSKVVIAMATGGLLMLSGVYPGASDV